VGVTGEGAGWPDAPVRAGAEAQKAVAAGARQRASAPNRVEWAPCSSRSRERADPLAATASRGMQWFLVEVEGPWGANAFVTSALGRELGQAIVHRVESAGMRPLAIRRVGRAEHNGAQRERGPQATWRWAFVDSRPGHEEVRWGTVDDPHDLLDVPLDGSTGIHSAEPVYCVCTHAKHDQCCAVHGRPVALALADEFAEATWECSHLGGDRFAGTMVIFPEGHYFGRADEVDAAQIVRDYRAGRVDERFYRGRSSLSHAAQAAQHYARLHFGDERLGSFAPLEEHPVVVPGGRRGVVEVVLAAPSPSPFGAGPVEGAGAAAALAGAGAGAGAAGASEHSGAAAVRVIVAETLSEPLLSTCAATRFGRVREFELVSLTPSRL
jgi:hypothetical protein